MAYRDIKELFLFNRAISKLACMPNNTRMREFWDNEWRGADADTKRKFIAEWKEHPEHHPEIITEVTKLRMQL